MGKYRARARYYSTITFTFSQVPEKRETPHPQTKIYEKLKNRIIIEINEQKENNPHSDL